jgi:hypothetical protein
MIYNEKTMALLKAVLKDFKINQKRNIIRNGGSDLQTMINGKIHSQMEVNDDGTQVDMIHVYVYDDGLVESWVHIWGLKNGKPHSFFTVDHPLMGTWFKTYQAAVDHYNSHMAWRQQQPRTALKNGIGCGAAKCHFCNEAVRIGGLPPDLSFMPPMPDPLQ